MQGTVAFEENVVEKRREIHRALTGSMNSLRTTPVVIRRGPAPPSWWTDDEDASLGNFQAMNEMQQRG